MAISSTRFCSASPSGAVLVAFEFLPEKERKVDAAWSALHAALAGRQAPVLERLHADTEPEEVAPYQQLRPMLAVPALYFVDQKDTLVELLQGDVTTVQIQSVLGSETKPR